MFSTGRIVFIACFVAAFVIMLVWSYRKEKKLNKVHFKHTYKVLLALIVLLILQFLIVKMRKFL
jgi:hypothetical protein